MKQLLCDLIVVQQEQGRNKHVFLLTVGRSAILKCSRDWHLHLDKCLFFSQKSRPWDEGLADCSVKEATLLLIQDKKELVKC